MRGVSGNMRQVSCDRGYHGEHVLYENQEKKTETKTGAGRAEWAKEYIEF